MALHHLRSFHRDPGDLLPFHMEDHVALQGGGGVIDMHDRLLASFNGLKGTRYQLLTALCQHLDDHIIRNELTVDQLAQKIKFNLAGCRKTDLDLLKAKFDQIIEKFDLLGNHHRIDQRLIAVTQIYAAPDRRFHDLVRRPFSFRILYYRILTIVLVI